MVRVNGKDLMGDVRDECREARGAVSWEYLTGGFAGAEQWRSLITSNEL